MKRPAFQFYPADWRKDSALQSCSLEAQGLWINLICIAHECEPYGHLTVNGRPMTVAQIARLVGVSAKDCERMLSEVVDAGVVSLKECGTHYSRRMVRDEELREARAEAGRASGHKGAEHGAKGAEHGVKGGRPRIDNPGNNPPSLPGVEPGQNPHPSSSSSPSKPSSLRSEERRASRSVTVSVDQLVNDYGVDKQVASDWMTVRKAKKSPLTQTALDNLITEFTAAGLTVADGVRTCVERSWVGFKPDWLKTDGGNTHGANQPVRLTAVDRAIADNEQHRLRREGSTGRTLDA